MLWSRSLQKQGFVNDDITFFNVDINTRKIFQKKSQVPKPTYKGGG